MAGVQPTEYRINYLPVPVPGADLPPGVQHFLDIGDDNGTPCTFIKSEINHDLNVSINKIKPAAVPKARNQNQIFTNSVVSETPCADNRSITLYDDDQLVEHIFGYTKTQLLNIPLDTEYNIRVKTQTDMNIYDAPNKTLSDAKIIRISKSNKLGYFKLFKYKKYSGGVGPAFNIQQMDSMNTQSSRNLPADEFHTYIVADTQTELFSKKIPSIFIPINANEKKVCFNIINTLSTLADAAGKTKPDGYVRKPTDSPYTWIYSWFQRPNSMLAGTATETLIRNNILTTNYKITQHITPYVSGLIWKISQTWELQNPPVGVAIGNKYTTIDANKDNNITSVGTQIMKDEYKYSLNNDLTTTINKLTKQSYSLLTQKKRSGDYLQLSSAYNFNTTDTITHNSYDCYRPFPNPTSHIISIPNNVMSAAAAAVPATREFNKYTFFTTGDWPAVCKAVSIKTNVIFKGRDCYLRISFD